MYGIPRAGEDIDIPRFQHLLPERGHARKDKLLLAAQGSFYILGLGV